MQHLNFLFFTVLKHDNRRTGGGNGEQAFHSLKEGTATFQKVPKLEFSSKICPTWWCVQASTPA